MSQPTTSQRNEHCLFCSQTKPHLFEIVGDLELAWLRSNVWLHLSVGVVNDGEEHVEKHEEYKEHVGHEEGRAKDAVGILDLVEVKVSEDDAEQGEAEEVSENKTKRSASFS